MRMAFLCFFWLFLMSLAQASTAKSLSFGSVPSWVVPREVTSASVSTVDGPVTYLLVDRQESFVNSEPQSFFRLAARVNNPAGLDALSQILANFNPSYERLVFHSVSIIRENITIAMPLLATDFLMIGKEKENERQNFDASMTATLLLQDLRVGDIVDYSYSIFGQHPLLGKKFSGLHELSWRVPVLEARIRQIWSSDTPMQWSVSDPRASIQQKIDGPLLITEWTGRKVPPILEEDLIPSWVDPFAAYRFSNWKDWAEVVNWALPFYHVNARSEAAIESLAEAIRRRFPESKNRVEEAIRFVQDDIRYLGIEGGDGSLKPRQPAEVLQSRYGDFKDKALLLTRLAQRLGYESFPILVRSEGGQGLERSPPTPLAFNHVVVGIKAPDHPDIYWVDGTLQHQGLTLEGRDYPSLYQGLPIKTGSAQLLKQDPALIPEGTIEYTEIFSADDFISPVTLTIRSRYLGWQAEKMRTDLAMQGSIPLSDNLANFVKKLYPDAELKKDPVFHDDRLANSLTVEESYMIPDLWQDAGGGAWSLGVAANAFISGSMAQPQKVKRAQNVLQTHSLRIVHRQDIRIPVEWSVPEDEQLIENRSFRYLFVQSYQDQVVSFVHEWESLQDQIPAKELPDYLRDAEQVNLQLQRSIHYQPKQATSFWKAVTLVFPQIIGLFILFLVAIGWQLQNDKRMERGEVWPRRSILFMLTLLILSSGAFALFWYADTDRRLRKSGRQVLPKTFMWLSLAIFSAALASRGIQLLIDPQSFQKIPLPLVAVIAVLHLFWAVATLRWLRRDFPEKSWHTWSCLIFGPLYFQSELQKLLIPPHSESAALASQNAGEMQDITLNQSKSLHPTEEGEEPRSDEIRTLS